MLILARIKTKALKGTLAVIFVIVFLYIMTGIDNFNSPKIVPSNLHTANFFIKNNKTVQSENSKSLSQLEKLKRSNALHFSYSVIEFEGKLTKMSINKGSPVNDKSKNEVHLVMGIGERGDKVTQYYASDSLNKIKLYRMVGGEKKEITFSDLSLGDEIVIKNIFNNARLYKNSLEESIITIK